MRQYGRYENERATLAVQMKKLLEALSRQIALSRGVPDLLPLETELSVLASYGFFSTLRASGDLGASLGDVSSRLPLPSCVATRLAEYAEQFGQSDREGEERSLRRLCAELTPLLDAEIEATRVRVRTFRVVTVATALSVAILFC